ncbi:MAG: hypothetical protein L0Z71_17810 [Anaerolineae bacterium]|nr:hypothetical protein [Anaerolineae bacterium]
MEIDVRFFLDLKPDSVIETRVFILNVFFIIKPTYFLHISRIISLHLFAILIIVDHLDAVALRQAGDTLHAIAKHPCGTVA